MPYIVQHIKTGKFYRGRTMKKLMSGDRLGRHSHVDVEGVREETDPTNPVHIVAKCFVRNPKSVHLYKKPPSFGNMMKDEHVKKILLEECQILEVSPDWKESLDTYESWLTWGKPKGSYRKQPKEDSKSRKA